MGNDIHRLAFERVLRNVLAFPTRPAVVVFNVMLPSSRFEAAVENDLLVIAQHYQLPVLSVRCTPELL